VTYQKLLASENSLGGENSRGPFGRCSARELVKKRLRHVKLRSPAREFAGMPLHFFAVHRKFCARTFTIEITPSSRLDYFSLYSPEREKEKGGRDNCTQPVGAPPRFPRDSL